MYKILCCQVLFYILFIKNDTRYLEQIPTTFQES